MARKIWTIDLEDGKHVIDLEHGYFSGQRKIIVDGKLLEATSKARHLFDMGSVHPIQINGHQCVIHIKTNGITFSYDLSVDGYSVGTGKPALPSALPSWAWIFIIACGIIPIISLGGAIPVAIGLSGAAMCASIAKDVSKSVNTSPYAASRVGCNSRRASNATCNARRYSFDLSAKWLRWVVPFSSSSLM